MSDEQASSTVPVPPPVPPTPKPERPHRSSYINPWRVFFGLCVTFVGLALLARQFGWDWVDPFLVLKFWPVFIILTGLSMLTRGGIVRTSLSILFVLCIIGVAVVGSVMQHRSTQESSYSATIAEKVTSAKVRLNVGGAAVTVDANGTDVVSGTARTTSGQVDVQQDVRDGVQYVTIEPKSVGASFFDGWRDRLTAHLNPTLPVALEIHSGASDLNLDLRSVHATSVAISSGAASVDLHLGDLVAENAVTIDAGASDISIAVPSTVGVDVQMDTAASSKDIVGLEKISNDHYQSSGYEAAEKKITISIHSGASSITIKR